MTLSARFESFILSRQGDEVVYGGRLADGRSVEIRQPVTDLDVMLVLVAQVFGRTINACETDQQAHRTDTVGVKPAEGGVILSLTCEHGVTRRFRLNADLAARLGGLLPETARRSRLRVLSSN
jgi:hypothetical protein